MKGERNMNKNSWSNSILIWINSKIKLSVLIWFRLTGTTLWSLRLWTTNRGRWEISPRPPTPPRSGPGSSSSADRDGIHSDVCCLLWLSYTIMCNNHKPTMNTKYLTELEIKKSWAHVFQCNYRNKVFIFFKEKHWAFFIIIVLMISQFFYHKLIWPFLLFILCMANKNIYNTSIKGHDWIAPRRSMVLRSQRPPRTRTARTRTLPAPTPR